MLRRIIYSLLVSGALSGCTETATPEAVEHDAATCAGYGFEPETDGMAVCMMQLDQERQAVRRERWEAVSVGLQNFSNSMQQSRMQTRYTSCTTSRLGLNWQTYCRSY